MLLFVRTVRRALPAEDPRRWIAARAAEDPALVAAATEGHLLVAEGLAEADRAAAEAALHRREDVLWTAATGHAVLSPEGRPMLVSWARIHWRDGRLFLRARTRLPGGGAGAEVAAWEGPADALPERLRALAPPRRAPRALFADQHPEWPEVPGVGRPDVELPLGDGATAEDAARAAGHAVEARLALTGVIDPAAVGWGEGRLALWYPEGDASIDVVQRITLALARDPRTRAVGIAGLGRPPGAFSDDLLAVEVILEPRDGGAVGYIRRLRRLPDGSARWLDPSGVVRVLPFGLRGMGWFARAEE